MPYSSAYLMKRAARGQSMPTDTPEIHLWAAIRSMTSMAIDDALHMGANPNIAGPGGQTALHQLLTAAWSTQSLRHDPRRILSCARSLLRVNANVMAIDPATRQTALERAARGAAEPAISREWRSLWQTRGAWRHPLGPDGRTIQDIWDAATPKPSKAPSP